MDNTQENKQQNKHHHHSSSSQMMNCENLPFVAKEAFKKLRVNTLIALSDDEKCHIVGVTSAQPSEGKSTIALNLAYSLAEVGKKVILIDGDMRRPSIHEKAMIRNSLGLSNLLTDMNTVSAVICPYPGNKENLNLDIIPGGDIPSNPSELLNSVRLSKLLEALKNSYDFIVLDLPPVGSVIDAVAVAKNTDGMIVVMRESNCLKSVFVNCIEQLKFAKINILGFVMNGSLEGTKKGYGYSKYSKYGYYNGYYNSYYK